jgi:hypothetical protein
MTTDFTLRWAKRYEEVEDVHNGSCRGFSMSEGVSGVACRVGLGVPQGSHLEHLLFHTVLLFKRNNVLCCFSLLMTKSLLEKAFGNCSL